MVPEVNRIIPGHPDLLRIRWIDLLTWGTRLFSTTRTISVFWLINYSVSRYEEQIVTKSYLTLADRNPTVFYSLGIFVCYIFSGIYISQSYSRVLYDAVLGAEYLLRLREIFAIQLYPSRKCPFCLVTRLRNF